jgi:hypothetical protein
MSQGVESSGCRPESRHHVEVNSGLTFRIDKPPRTPEGIGCDLAACRSSSLVSLRFVSRIFVADNIISEALPQLPIPG